MTVTNVHKDPDALTMTITSEFAAPIKRMWQMWEDPRQLERWWGPPTHPATIVEHAFSPGGSVTYFMTGPDGDQYHGWWRILVVDAPRRLEFEDGFADGAGVPDPDMPVTITRITLSELQVGNTRMAIETLFPSVEVMEKVLSMGAEEGTTAALSQIDGIL